MRVSLWVREARNGKRRFVKPNKKKRYPDGTIFCLRYAANGKRRWETLDVKNLNAALAARATREAALLMDAPNPVSTPAKRINVNDGIATYLTTVSAMRAHKTWLAYNLALNEFRKSCSKDHLDQIDKADLTAFVVAQKKAGQDDRTVSNRVGAVVTFLRANGIVTVTLRLYEPFGQHITRLELASLLSARFVPNRPSVRRRCSLNTNLEHLPLCVNFFSVLHA
jgi:hypothetical protein